MIDPLASGIAAALATGATAALGDGVRALITKLGALVRDRLRRSPPDAEALMAATGGPGDPDARQRLAELLDQHMREDSEFAGRLRAIWTELIATGTRDEVTNLVHGQVHGSVIQAHDVHGGITIHPPGGH